MSPVGSIDDTKPETKLVLRPRVWKTLIKGVVAIAVFSLFLNISTHFFSYIVFLSASLVILLAFICVKHESKFMIGDQDITIKRIFVKSRTISYGNIFDLTISQGFLAKRFDCGSVYIVLKRGSGSVTLTDGRKPYGSAERLDDVPNPAYISDLISSKLGPYSSPPGL